MAARPRLGFFLLTGLIVVVCCYVLMTQPEPGVITEAFPVGLLAGVWLVVSRRHWSKLLPLVVAFSSLVYLANGRELAVALGWGLAAGLGAHVTARGLTRGANHRAALLSEDDLRSFITYSFAGAAVAAVVTTATTLATGHAQWWVTALGVFTAHFATYMVLLPHFMGRPRFPGVAPLGERVIQWFATVIFTVLVFSVPIPGPTVAFCIIPFIGWSALRAPMRETLVQLLVVVVITHTMTIRGLGPFAIPAGVGQVEADLRSVLFAVFVCALALVTIPFSLAVGIQRRESWQARQEQARVRQLVQSASGVAIIGTDRHGYIDLFNPGAEQMFGYSASEVEGLVPSIFLTQGEIQRLATKFGCAANFADVASTLAASDTESLDVEFLGKDNSVLTLQFSMSQVVDAEGRVQGYVSTGEDVTARVKREAALEEALARERLAVENLREVDQVKDTLVSGVSHELRTPITSILGYLEMLEDGGFGELAEAQLRALQRVRGNSNRLMALIDDLLTLSRIQDGYVDLDPRDIDLRDVVESVREEMAPEMLAAGLNFRVDLPVEPVQVRGDAERLCRALVNMVGNSAKFTDRFGKVEVALRCEDSWAVVAIEDNGIGIPEAEQGELFERFFRATSAHERAIQGSGLGLSIARALIESHGGRIEVESVVEEGTTFRVWLPLESAPAAAAPLVTAPQRNADRPGVVAQRQVADHH
ncbi:sensor histidine kinase [Nocardioides gilvus]|uniref:sensor histidine kinase n=1 Tax=Nocardioides gilvus TaxID=1735589 RepID=UPI000D74C21F|nr:PAS domain-containing sensor histidine kinase [Nocardioides gilvus]